MNYFLHGMLLGFLISLINSLSFLKDGIRGFIFFTIAGIIYGLLIEFFANKVFRASLPTPAQF